MAIRVPSRTRQRPYGYVNRYSIACPLLTTPDDEEVTENSVTLVWGGVTGAAVYYVYVWADEESDVPLASTSATSYELSGLTPGVAYTWRITAENHRGESDGCGTRTFEVALPSVQFESAAYTSLQDETIETVTVTRTTPTNIASTVSYATSDGTAIAGVDYTATSGTLTFAVGEISKTIDITILQWTTEKSFYVTLSDPINATIGTPNPTVVTLAAAEVDEFADQVWSLLRFNDAADSTDFVDEIPERTWIQLDFNFSDPVPVTVVANGLYGNCAKGSNLDYFDDNSAIRNPITEIPGSPEFLVEGGEFCWEASAKFTSFGASSGMLGQCLFSVFGASQIEFYAYVRSDGKVVVERSIIDTVIVSDTALSVDTWHAICLERVGDVATLYIDGVAQSQTWSITTSNVTGAVQYFNLRGLHGGRQVMDECRITEAARYRGNYTPRTTEFPDPTP